MKDYEVDVVEDSTSITKEKTMSIVSKFKLALMKEPERSFVNKGILNNELNFTTEGRALFELFLLEKHKVEFKTEVVDKIEIED